MKMKFLTTVSPLIPKIKQWITRPTSRTGGDDIVIIPKFLTASRCYHQARKITPKGILIHSPAVANPDWKWLYRRWNRPEATACTHAIVTRTQCIQLLPWNYRCWGAGRGENGSANATHIQIDVCEPAGHRYIGSRVTGYDIEANRAYMQDVWNRTVALCAHLCERFGIDPVGIVDHSEAASSGVASKHLDWSHWIRIHGLNMDKFRRDVQNALTQNLQGVPLI